MVYEPDVSTTGPNPSPEKSVANSMSDNRGDDPVRLNLHPLPGTPEAIAHGCRCAPATKPDRSPRLDNNGKQLYRIEKGCPVHL